MSRLYEELETQISGEQAKAAQEHRQRGARVLATLEEEVRERRNFRKINNKNLISKSEKIMETQIALKLK